MTRSARALAGGLTALTGLAVAQLAARVIGPDDSPVEAVGTYVIRHAPGPFAERAIRAVGHADKPILVTGVVVVVTLVLAFAATRPRILDSVVASAVLAALGAAAIVAEPGQAGMRLVPVVVGLATWLVLLPVLLEALPRPAPADLPGEDPHGGDRRFSPSPEDRRSFVVRSAVVAVAGGVALLGSRYAGSGRREVERARSRLRIPGVTKPVVPAGADLGVDGQQPWLTPVGDFYRIDTALLPPAVDTAGWKLRIHGMVDHPLELTFDDLLARQLTEDWITLCCVSNTVGGDLIGNAWWSGIRVAPLLAEAGVKAGADGVLQTSSDGWTCLTPVETLTDNRNAILAVAMNGSPLTVEHGFPVRMVVPGLYGYVSATKWLVDLEVTTFEKATGYWTNLGWSARGPVKIASRIDVPTNGGSATKVDEAGRTVLAGTAWHQHTGIRGVEVSVDGGPWTAAELAVDPTVDCWVQWRYATKLSSGHHQARVRAIGADGEVQTGASAEPAPDGATGWDRSNFEVA